MSESIGQQLRAARNSLSLTIEDVAHKTRVHRDVLRQLEADEFEKLPNLMFAKSFLKIYCEHVGVDTSDAIAQFSAADDHQAEQFLLGGVSQEVRDRFGRLTSRIHIRPIVASAAAVVFLGISGTYLVSHLYGNNQNTVQPPPIGSEPTFVAANPSATPAGGNNSPAETPQENETAPVNKSGTPIVLETVPRTQLDNEVSKAVPVDPASIPKAIIRKAEPVEPEAADDTGTTEDETYEPFEVSPAPRTTED
ncbi:MAG: cytoskeleton protein RodZ [Pseudoalteromonas tetraodonis]|jgi:cytoskeleton protein RodZ